MKVRRLLGNTCLSELRDGYCHVLLNPQTNWPHRNLPTTATPRSPRCWSIALALTPELMSTILSTRVSNSLWAVQRLATHVLDCRRDGMARGEHTFAQGADEHGHG